MFYCYCNVTLYLEVTSKQWRPCFQTNLLVTCGKRWTVRDVVGGGGRKQLPPLKNCLFVGRLSSKNTRLGAEKFSFWGNLGSKLKFWAPIIFSVGKSAAIYRKITTSCVHNLFNPRCCCEQSLDKLRLWLSGIALRRKPVSELRSVTCHMGSHSVTCHPTQVNTPRHNPSHAGRYSIYLPWTDGRLSWPWWLVIYRDGLPVRRQSPIQVLTSW